MVMPITNPFWSHGEEEDAHNEDDGDGDISSGSIGSESGKQREEQGSAGEPE
jgi:hypothetical protein